MSDTGFRPPPGWRPDPSGRHEHRLWDGQAWTDRVLDGDQQGIDPPTTQVGAIPTTRSMGQTPVPMTSAFPPAPSPSPPSAAPAPAAEPWSTPAAPAGSQSADPWVRPGSVVPPPLGGGGMAPPAESWTPPAAPASAVLSDSPPTAPQAAAAPEAWWSDPAQGNGAAAWHAPDTQSLAAPQGYATDPDRAAKVKAIAIAGAIGAFVVIGLVVIFNGSHGSNHSPARFANTSSTTFRHATTGPGSSTTAPTSTPPTTAAVGPPSLPLSGTGSMATAAVALNGGQVTVALAVAGGSFSLALVPDSPAGAPIHLASCASACKQRGTLTEPKGTYHFDVRAAPGATWTITVSQ